MDLTAPTTKLRQPNTEAKCAKFIFLLFVDRKLDPQAKTNTKKIYGPV